MPTRASQRRTVTVFGGTGFLGRRIVRALAERGFGVRVATRQLGRTDESAGKDGAVEGIHADVNDEQAVARALVGVYGVVNAVSLYVERGGHTFRSVHVDAAERVARHAGDAGADCLVHVSGIGSDAASSSPYIRSRGEGEQIVQETFSTATVVRPAVMIGPDDAFLTPLRALLRRLPILALFGRGRNLLQPVHVEDVGEAIARIVDGPSRAPVYEFGGPHVYSYAELLRMIARRERLRRLFVPTPFALWQGGAWLAERLPEPPITRNQVESMRLDSICSGSQPGLEDLGISCRSVEQTLEAAPTRV